MTKDERTMDNGQKTYWDTISDDYQKLTTIKTSDFHFGPLLPGNSNLNILPEIKTGTTCLELGCGAAQNSIFLAKQGATCTAIDISPKQIKHANTLAEKHNVNISLDCFPLENGDAWPNQKFDLVHSVYTLAFIKNPEEFIKNAVDNLAPGGTFLLITKHPIFCAEWLELEDEEMGLFLPSYFEPIDDMRENSKGDLIISRSYPISTISNWIHKAGLQNLQIWEPQPLPVDKLESAPYHSPAWIDLHPKLSAAPVSIIYSAQKI